MTLFFSVCQPGYDDQSGVCTKCVVDTFKDVIGVGPCTACPDGSSTNNLDGQTTCGKLRF